MSETMDARYSLNALLLRVALAIALVLAFGFISDKLKATQAAPPPKYERFTILEESSIEDYHLTVLCDQKTGEQFLLAWRVYNGATGLSPMQQRCK